MTEKRLPGIDGILGNLISTPMGEAEARPKTTRKLKHEKSQRARLGRPPGKSNNVHSPREKVTFRISSDLIAEYRDRSWEARCSLSGLVERAMIEYRQHFRE